MKVLLAITLFLYAALADADNEIDITYYTSDKSSAPIQIPSENRGIVTDVLQKLDMPNVNLVHRTLPFKRMILMLEKSTAPWITYGSAKWKDSRANNLSVTPLFIAQHILMTLSETPYISIDDILDKGLVLIRGFNYPGLIDFVERNPTKVFYVKTHEAAIKMVQSGRVAAFVGMNSRVSYHLNKMAIDRKTIVLHDFSDIIPNYGVNLSFSNNFPKALRSSIESQLSNLKKTGQLEAILQKYQ